MGVSRERDQKDRRPEGKRGDRSGPQGHMDPALSPFLLLMRFAGLLKSQMGKTHYLCHLGFAPGKTGKTKTWANGKWESPG